MPPELINEQNALYHQHLQRNIEHAWDHKTQALFMSPMRASVPYAWLCLSLSVPVCFCLSGSLSICFCLHLSVCIFLSVSSCLYLSACLSVCLSACLSVCLSVCLSTLQSCLSLSLHVCCCPYGRVYFGSRLYFFCLEHFHKPTHHTFTGTNVSMSSNHKQIFNSTFVFTLSIPTASIWICCCPPVSVFVAARISVFPIASVRLCMFVSTLT